MYIVYYDLFSGAAIYDIDFNPHFNTQFAAVSDNGRVAVWDMRRCDRAEKHWPGHAEYTFTCRWHPEVKSHSLHTVLVSISWLRLHNTEMKNLERLAKTFTQFRLATALPREGETKT